MAPHSSTLAWKIPWTGEPGGLQSMGSLRVGHDWVTSLSLFTLCTGEGNGNPLQCSCLENPRDGEACWAAVYGVAQGRTRLRQLSSSSSYTDIIWSPHFIQISLVFISCPFFLFQGPNWTLSKSWCPWFSFWEGIFWICKTFCGEVERGGIKRKVTQTRPWARYFELD